MTSRARGLLLLGLLLPACSTSPKPEVGPRADPFADAGAGALDARLPTDATAAADRRADDRPFVDDPGARDGGTGDRPSAPDSAATTDTPWAGTPWLKSFHGDFAHFPRVAADRQGNLFVSAGIFGSTDLGGAPPPALAGEDGALIASLTPAGAVRWVRTFAIPGRSTADRPPPIVVDAAGRVHVAGSFQDTLEIEAGTRLASAGQNDVFVVSFDNGGKLLGAARFGGALNEAALDLAVDSAGRLYVACAAVRVDNSPGDTVLALDEGRALRWGRRVGQQALAVTMDRSDNPIVAFASAFPFDLEATRIDGSEHAGTLFVSYDPAGAVRWHGLAEGTTLSPAPQAMETDAAGNVYVAGTFDDTIVFGQRRLTAPRDGFDAFVASLDAAGQPRWATSVGASTKAWAADLAVADDGTVRVVGHMDAPIMFGGNTLGVVNPANATSFLVTLNSEGGPGASQVWNAPLVGVVAGGITLTPGAPAAMAVTGIANLGFMEMEGSILIGGQPLHLSQGGANLVVARLTF